MRMLRTFRPRSLSGVILAGFVVVMLPLWGALAVAAWSVQELAQQGQGALVRAVTATREGRALVAALTSLERSARQYRVLGRDDLLGVYRDNRGTLLAIGERLSQLPLDAGRAGALGQLLTQVGELGEAPAGSDAELAKRFAPLAELARDFLDRSNTEVEAETQRLEDLSVRLRHRLVGLAIASVPAGLVLAGLVTLLVSGPMRRLAQAIRRLGGEDFSTPVKVRGPRDLEALGERLDWLRQRLAELEAQKARFLRHVSHELKTPLTALREGADLLGSEAVGPLNADQREIAVILSDNAKRLQRLIEDLLNFNRALARDLAATMAPVDVRAAVSEVVEAQRMAWQARSVHVVQMLPALTVPTDRARLNTIVDNLLSNAIKFSPHGGVVEVRASVVGNAVQLDVEDTGPGFAAHERARVFEAFFQGSTQPDGPVRGSGLGLAIAREFALLLGGRLEVVDGVGGGGCVRLSLPLGGRG